MNALATAPGVIATPGKYYIGAKEVMEYLDCKENKAYELIRQLRDELVKAGKLTPAYPIGKVPRKYFFERCILNILGMDSFTFKSCALIMQDQYGLFLQAKPEERVHRQYKDCSRKRYSIILEALAYAIDYDKSFIYDLSMADKKLKKMYLEDFMEGFDYALYDSRYEENEAEE